MKDHLKHRLLLSFNLLVCLTAVMVLTTGITIWIYLDPQLGLGLEKTKESFPTPQIVDGVHINSGLKDGEGLQMVLTNCTACHSARLITQNRATKEGWKNMIRWMQQTQNLWSLGENEEAILNYLAKNYSPKKKGRRANLEKIEWYELEQ